MKAIILSGILAAGVLAGLGCEAEVTPAPVAVGADIDLGPNWGYYNQGAWVGGVWVWHDQYGHEFHEARDMHDRRMARFHETHRGVEEHHQEHHEEHR